VKWRIEEKIIVDEWRETNSFIENM